MTTRSTGSRAASPSGRAARRPRSTSTWRAKGSRYSGRAHRARPQLAPRVAARVEARAHVAQRERAGAGDRVDLAPLDRRRHRRARLAAERVRRDRGGAERVAQDVEVEALAAILLVE